ncbi:MAG: hypothetical protein WCJ37_18900, partial [Syntrophus sp. (in: bacteria)]
LFDEQTRHDGFAGARIIGKEKAQRLTRQHGLINSRDLVRQRVHNRGVDGEHRVEEVGKADAVRFGNQTEQPSVTVKTPRPTLLYEIKTWLVMSIEKFV